MVGSFREGVNYLFFFFGWRAGKIHLSPRHPGPHAHNLGKFCLSPGHEPFPRCRPTGIEVIVLIATSPAMAGTCEVAGLNKTELAWELREGEANLAIRLALTMGEVEQRAGLAFFMRTTLMKPIEMAGLAGMIPWEP